MSSDYLEDVESEDGASVLLTMRASGFVQLIILEPDEGKKDYDGFIYEVTKEGAIARFSLIPNKKGIQNAEKIAEALKAWVEHIQLVGLVQGDEINY